MSEYWKSTPKYWCKHCKAYVVDTKLGRSQHDATGRHQGNLKRFLQDLHRNHETETSRKEAAKREVARLEAITGGGKSSGGFTSATASFTGGGAAARAPSEAERKRQLKELESLGVALPEEYRKDLALPGDWVAADTTGTSGESKKRRLGLGSSVKQEEEESKEKAKEEIAKRRKVEEEEKKWNNLDDDEKALKGFKIETKTYPVDGDGSELDAPIVFGKGKSKHVPPKAPVGGSTGGEEIPTDHTEDGMLIKKEQNDASPDLDTTAPQQAVEEKPVGEGVMFKKRKVKNMRKK